MAALLAQERLTVFCIFCAFSFLFLKKKCSYGHLASLECVCTAERSRHPWPGNGQQRAWAPLALPACQEAGWVRCTEAARVPLLPSGPVARLGMRAGSEALLPAALPPPGAVVSQSLCRWCSSHSLDLGSEGGMEPAPGPSARARQPGCWGWNLGCQPSPLFPLHPQPHPWPTLGSLAGVGGP